MSRETAGREHTSIKIEEVDQQLASSIQRKLCRNSPLPAQCCIFRVPISLRRHNNDVFVPNLVSIGPFHHGKRNLKAMERVKLWYLHCLLTRSPTPETSLDRFVKAIREKEPDYRGCYAEQLKFSEDQFIEMMVVDGCFVIEVFRRNAELVSRDKDDPLLNMSWMYIPLMSDLLLLENQLPWPVLECLWNLTASERERNSHTLPHAAFLFLNSFMLKKSSQLENSSSNKHLLDFLRNNLLSSLADKDLEESGWHPIPCVTELLQAGVEFKMGNANDLLNITFNNGVMEIPPIFIQENAESLLRNLIAFEQCDSRLYNKITSYAVLLDCLIESSKDVEFLHQKGIVENVLSSEDIAGFFNRLINDACIDNFTYTELCQNVNAYYQGRCHRWKAALSRDYFGNPWSIMSFSAAILILALTFIQTFFAVFPRNKSF